MCRRVSLARLGPTPPVSVLSRLLLLNLVLQVFDGIEAYEGLRLGWREANPLLVMAFSAVGVGPALVVLKVQACAFLWAIHRLAPPQIAGLALGGLASVYTGLSLLPWLGKFTGFALALALS